MRLSFKDRKPIVLNSLFSTVVPGGVPKECSEPGTTAVLGRLSYKQQIPLSTRLYQQRYLFWRRWRDLNSRVGSSRPTAFRVRTLQPLGYISVYFTPRELLYKRIKALFLSKPKGFIVWRSRGDSNTRPTA